jgi:hypothetical protein
MGKAFTLSFCLFTMLKVSVGQVAPDNLILTKAQSDAWISRLELAPIDAQIDLIRDRIVFDTNVYVRSSYPDRIRLQDESENGKKIEVYSRPFIVINGKCQHYHVNITNRTKNESVRQLAALLTGKNINLVTVQKDDNAMAIYGSRAIGGVIILSAKNRTVCKQFERVKLD